ncbi:protein of unknown function [Methylocella tundrae]|uniref:Sulfotransferase family protein n=1 Tax=Methylocella tundrae TaxID=227605 RepID=A0A4V6IMB2_METTU|nr:protein of unknown function [Methylocella tundrae]
MDRNLMRKVILVVGMHRSGTSAITGTMVQLGLGAPLTLMPSNNENERGYWESLRISVLHDELLAAAGSSWRDWRAFDRTWHHSVCGNAFRTRAKLLFGEEFGEAELFCLQGPAPVSNHTFLGGGVRGNANRSSGRHSHPLAA